MFEVWGSTRKAYGKTKDEMLKFNYKLVVKFCDNQKCQGCQ